MPSGKMSDFLSHLRRAVLRRDGAGLTDGQLLEDYRSRRDQAALEILVRRHAALVWGVCRRVLGNHHDAEDAFQATFLILVRKAASIASPRLLANWLYGVAHQTARKARATAAKRRARERQVTQMPEPAAAESDLWNDVQPLLDQELSRLPDIYRVAIVLCDLEGKTRKEAARQLGVPDGTLAARLARGRVLLAKRLARHGVSVSGGALGMILGQHIASAGVPTSVVSSAIKAASVLAAGQAAAVGLVSAKAAALTEGMLQTMLLSKIKVATAVLLVVTAVGAGGNRLLVSTRAAQGAAEPKQVQKEKPQPPQGKDQLRIYVKPHPDGEFRLQGLVVRDPSSGEYKVLTRDGGIPVVKGYIEFHVKKLKEARDDKSIRDALKNLEESVQNMKELLSLPGGPADKKPEDKKPAEEKPPLNLGQAGDAWEMNARRLLAGRSLATPPGATSRTIHLPATLILDLARQLSEWSEPGVQVRLDSYYPFCSRRGGGPKGPPGDAWEMDARRWLAGRVPRNSPWGAGDTWEMNDFWHFSPWRKGDTWELNTRRILEKDGFWSFPQMR
jgi:RNA polymerase sigma factor (sigma-70 family)